MTKHISPRILMADDDEDDCFMAREAFEDSGIKGHFSCVEDGEKLLDYLGECLMACMELPSLILLDLNMPRMNGHDALIAIRSNMALKHIPVIILTTSGKDYVRSGTIERADHFITKPPSYDQWVEIMKSLADFLAVNAPQSSSGL